MAKYERFVVYPLLFTTLFCSLAGISVVKANPEVLERVVTKELVVVNDAGKEIAVIREGDDPSVYASFRLNDANGAIMTHLKVCSDGSSFVLGIPRQEDQDPKTAVLLSGTLEGSDI